MLVGGGSIFTFGPLEAGNIEALALGLVPIGLTPVAFFPPTPEQSMPSLSVIFQEPDVRQKRSLNYNINGKFYDINFPATQKLYCLDS